jgi:hypothetical protein
VSVHLGRGQALDLDHVHLAAKDEIELVEQAAFLVEFQMASVEVDLRRAREWGPPTF